MDEASGFVWVFIWFFSWSVTLWNRLSCLRRSVLCFSISSLISTLHLEKFPMHSSDATLRKVWRFSSFLVQHVWDKESWDALTSLIAKSMFWMSFDRFFIVVSSVTTAFFSEVWSSQSLSTSTLRSAVEMFSEIGSESLWLVAGVVIHGFLMPSTA